MPFGLKEDVLEVGFHREVGFNIEGRERALLRFYQEHGWKEDAKWTVRRLERLGAGAGSSQDAEEESSSSEPSDVVAGKGASDIVDLTSP